MRDVATQKTRKMDLGWQLGMGVTFASWISRHRPIARNIERLRISRVSWSSPGYDWDELFGRWRDPKNAAKVCARKFSVLDP